MLCQTDPNTLVHARLHMMKVNFGVDVLCAGSAAREICKQK